MLAIICDDTWNVLNMQHLTTNSKRWDYPDVPGGGYKQIKGPAYMCERVSMPWGRPDKLICWSEAKYNHVYTNQSHWEYLESFCVNEIEIELSPCLGVDWMYMQIIILSFVVTKLIYQITRSLFYLYWWHRLVGDHYFMPWDLIVVSTLCCMWLDTLSLRCDDFSLGFYFAHRKLYKFADSLQITFTLYITDWSCFTLSEIPPPGVKPLPMLTQVSSRLYASPWASYQIRKIVGCACAGNAGNVLPDADFKGNRQ